MSNAVVNRLRARKVPLRLAPEGAPAITIRVEMPEVWDVIRVITPAEEPVLAVKTAALEALFPEAEFHEDFILKLRGWEILDESASLASVGVVDGSILLLTHRRRRPVR
jgi:hypothetical protein